jgi:hypothetical protein
MSLYAMVAFRVASVVSVVLSSAAASGSTSSLIRREAVSKHGDALRPSTTTTVTSGVPRPSKASVSLEHYPAASFPSSLLQIGSGAPVVWCGGHAATECPACPAGFGPDFCNGECAWESGSCFFRQDLFWCGSHAAGTCADCIQPGASGEQNVKWCSGDCDMYGGECMSRAEINKKEKVQEVAGKPVKKTAQVEELDLPSENVIYYGKDSGNLPVRHKQKLQFYDYGCCRYDFTAVGHETSEREAGPKTVSACMDLCLETDSCVGADVGGAQLPSVFQAKGEHEFGCRLYVGGGLGFYSSCDNTYHCYRKVLPGTDKEPDLAPDKSLS